MPGGLLPYNSEQHIHGDVFDTMRTHVKLWRKVLEETDMRLALRRGALTGVAVASLGLVAVAALLKGLEASECALYKPALIWTLRSMGWVRV